MTTTPEAHRATRRTSAAGAVTREPSARRLATRERLLDAAVELFAERGVLAASVEEICERAGFTRGAFYSNFESKDELCLGVLRRKCEQYLDGLQAAIEVIPEVRSGETGLEGLVDQAVVVFLEGQPKDLSDLIAMMELRLYALRNPDLREGWLAEHHGIISSVSRLLDIALQRVGARLSMPTPLVIERLGAVYENTISMSGLNGEKRATGLAEQLATLLEALVVRDCD